MSKIPFSKIVPGAVIAITALAIVTVFFRNVFPPLDDMIVIDGTSAVSSPVNAGVISSVPGFGNPSGGYVNSDTSLGDSRGEESLASTDNIADGKININTASVSELMKLSGIGETRAKAIVEYRTAHGSFSSIDELLNVSGIGEKTLEKNRDMITV